MWMTRALGALLLVTLVACEGGGAATDATSPVDGQDAALGGPEVQTDLGARDLPGILDLGDIPSQDTTTPPSLWQVGNLGAGERDLRGLWCASGEDCLAVGAGGVLLQLRGAGWLPAGSGTRADLHDVFGFADGGAVAVGARGTVLVREEGRWRSACDAACQAELPRDPDSGELVTLRAVWGESPARFFVAGDQGAVLRFESAQWHREQTGLSSRLVCMWGRAATDLYVGGEQGQMLHRNGSTWTARQIFDSNAAAAALWGAESGELWTVGTAGRTARLGADGSWERKETNDSYERDLHAVWGDGPDRVWAVGDDGALLRWRDGRWGLEEIEGPNFKGADFRALAGGVGEDGVLRVFALGLRGAALGRNPDMSWTDRRPGPDQSLLAIWGPADEGPAVAVGEGGVILEASEGGPSPLALVESDARATLRGVDGLDGTWWAVGDEGTVLRRDESGWRAVPVEIATGLRLSGVRVSSSGRVIAVGERGAILAGGDEAWRLEPGDTLANLLGLWASPSGEEAWAVAEDGSVLRRGAGGWQLAARPVTTPLRAVWSDGTHVWVAGDGGVVAEGDAAGFALVHEAPGSFFYGLAGLGAGAPVAAAGWAGEVLVRGEAGWSPEPTGTFQELRALHLWQGGAVAVGRGGVYLSRDFPL